jgi:hypothetical protein
MVNLPGVNHLAAQARKAPVVAAIVIALVMLAAAAVYAACCDPFVFGIMPPERPAPGSTDVQYGDGQRYVYKVTSARGGATTFSRNDTLWLTVKVTPSGYEISDPRGTGKTVIRLSAH